MTFQAQIMAGGLQAEAAKAIVGYYNQIGQTATGSTQATAFPVSGDTQFTTVAASTGAILPAFANEGDMVFIGNQGANPLLVYPPVGGQINALAANASFSQTNAKNAWYKCVQGGAAALWLAVLSA
jgi:hypothetical protein